MRPFLCVASLAALLPGFALPAGAQALNTPFSPTQASVTFVPAAGVTVRPPAPGAQRTPAQPVVAIATPARPRFCPEGRTFTGECVRPILAQAARLTSCINTQGLLSASAGLPCTSVLQDNDFRYPNAVYAETKRSLDIAFNRRASSFNSYSYFVERVGPGTPNPTRYPITYGR